MRNAWLALALAGCYGGLSAALVPRGTQDCPELDSCALAIGTQVVADAIAFTDVDESAIVDSLEVTPAGIVDATVLQNQAGVLLQPRAAGSAHVHAVLRLAGTAMPFDKDLRVAEIATTKLQPTIYPVGIGPIPDHIAAFTGASIELAVTYADAMGQAMLGSGIENWSTTSGQLGAAFADGAYFDSSRFRTLIVGTEAATVTANATTLTIDARPAGSTTQLDLGACGWLGMDGAILPVGNGDKLDVVARAADGLAILGTSPSGPPAVTLEDPSVLGLTVQDQSLIVATKQAGHSTALHLSFDGAISSFTLGAQ